MNREVLLELLSNKTRTFRDVSATGALRAVRDEVVRTRTTSLARPILREAPETPPAPGIDVQRLAAELDDTRIEDLPEMAAHLEHAHLYVVASFVEGSDEWVDAAAAVGGPAGLDAAALERLVGERRIDETTAHHAGFNAALYEAVGRDTKLMRIVREARFPISGGPARSTIDLARTSRAEWESALGPHEIAGRPIAAIAATLADRFAAMHPGPAFLARLATPLDDRIARAIADAEPLFARNDKVFGVPAQQLDVTGLDGDRVRSALAAHGVLRTAILGHPDLELRAILDDRARSVAERAEIVGRRIGYVQRFQRAVGEDRVLFLDYGPRSNDLAALAELGASAEEQTLVLRTLKTHQRVFALGGTPEAGAALLGRGFANARAIARLDAATFASQAGAAVDAPAVHERATRLASDAAIVAASLLDLVEDPIAETNAANVPPSSLDYLRELDGFEQLFGSLAFCACEECNSILGPAAYFVDLMRFVDGHARSQFASHPGHPLDLKTRRPDLWSLPLTCENTRDRVPVLEIVDEVLEAFIASASGFTGTRDEQRRRVYEALATTQTSFALPFHLAVARVDRSLGATNTTRADIARALGRGTDAWARARLTLAPAEGALITTPDLDLGHHRARYGVDFQLAGSEIAPVDVQALLRRLPVDREALSVLIATQFVTSPGDQPRIVAEKRTADSIQNDIERVHGLTPRALDRMHRLVRLARHVPWTLPELDRSLSALELVEIDANALVQIARLLEIQHACSLDLDDAYAIAGALDASRIARVFGVSLPQLQQMCSLAGLAFPIASTETILALRDHERWRSESGYGLDDLAIAMGQEPLDGSHRPSAAVIARRVADHPAPLTFEPLVFAVSTGVAEAASQAILDENPTRFVRVGARWRIADGADLTALTVPASALVTTTDGSTRALTAAEAAEVLAPFVPSTVLARRLGESLALPASKVRALAAIADADLGDPAIIAALLAGPIAPLEALVATLVPFAVAFQHASWDAAALDHVAAHRAAYGIGASLDLDALHGFSVVANVRAALPADAATDIAGLVEAFTPGVGFAASADEALARVLGIDLALVQSLQGRLPASTSAPLALGTLRRAAHLARDLGVDGASLASAVSDDGNALATAADALAAALPRDVASAIDRDLLELRRDALAAYAIEVVRPDVFRDLDDLSAYFLLDVRGGACQTSSRVVAATSSVQQYVHRLVMRLEQDRRTADDPDHLEVGLSREAIDEWSWRKNYRVWEANRKVFLWPENYLEPDLRDDKTPLFVELEQDLLQGEVNDQTVLDAYAKYLTGFEELANLTIAGAYHDVATAGRDVLHLFGVTSTDPATFYYRTCEDLLASGRDPTTAAVWSPWRKVAAQITGRRVSPVVFDGRLHVFWTDYKTRSRTKIVDGGSEFDGYQHTMRLRFTTLRLDGTWTPPQDVQLPGWDKVTDEFLLGRGILHDWFTTYPPGTGPRPRFGAVGPHPEPLDDYTLSGPNWDWVWPEPARLATRNGLFLRYRNFTQCGEVDLFKRELVRSIEPAPRDPRPQVLCANGKDLFYGTPLFWNQSLTSVANLVIDSERIDGLLREDLLALYFKPGLYQAQIARLADKANLLALPGNVEDAIVQIGCDVLLLQGSITHDHRYVVRRLGTTLATRLARTLFADGVESLLDISTQKTLREAGLPFTPVGSHILDRSNRGTLDFKGPYGTYFREIFFHIPALVANHLNSQGHFASAQRWYQYIFDPTASEVISVPPSTPPLERERRLRDRVWRYLELRGLDATSLRAALTDPAALEKYRRDPFNPHAIARLRITAYQKAIVMRYIDNLLDWGDHLFTQFTMESVNEAVMLYLTAADILGNRPAELGPCADTGDTPRTYETIAAQLATDSELLIELESWLLGRRVVDHAVAATTSATAGMTIGSVSRPALVHAIGAHPLHGPLDAVISDDPDVDYGAPTTDASFTADWNRTGMDTWSPALAKSTSFGANLAGGRPTSRLRDARSSDFRNAPATNAVVRGLTTATGGRAANAATYAAFMVDQLGPAFCVPPNTELHAYWDRLDDRLFKIRNCMDITGQVRELALVEPAIDPRLLIQGMAIGADLGEMANVASGALPPYRFTYLIERAKSYAATLQGFGAAMLAALEKKDGEEMSRLSIVHQKNIASLSTGLRTLDIEIAEHSLSSTEIQRDAAIARRDFYQGLLDEGNNGWEVAERIARHYASLTHVLEGSLRVMASTATALPQVGSPFAMKYGGVELGGSLGQAAAGYGALGLAATAAAGSAALEGNYARRNEGWRHQRDLARRDVESLERQVQAATARVKQAERSLVVHQRSLDQIDEVSALLANRFSNLGRYTWLAQQLQRLYRDAYDSAIALARLAEQAYRFERDEDPAPGLDSSYWETGHAGLLAGERLFIGLQQLERRFLETHDRTHEIDQPIALGQIDPIALLRLRETGSCEFTIPELAYDLFYPGHYKRCIKGVRLTIPCITGPYTNVSATLELLGSAVRRSSLEGQSLLDVPPRRTTSIATSTAQNDGGVFEMSFRDERYLPFEGAGAVSTWRLTLPSIFRPFDYSTITDVIMSVSYTALFDGALRARVENTNAAVEGSLLHFVRTNPLTRVLSLRQDFSAAFTRLLRSPIDTEVRFELTDRHFPLFAGGKPLRDVTAMLVIRTQENLDPGSFALELDGAVVDAWLSRPELGGLRGAELPPSFTSSIRPATHTVRIRDAGSIGTASDDNGAVDSDKLLDAFLVIEYKL